MAVEFIESTVLKEFINCSVDGKIIGVIELLEDRSAGFTSITFCTSEQLEQILSKMKELQAGVK
jgi:hypothetical protein